MSPYKEHKVFEIPHDVNVKIWRYMDITKYISLLDKKALYFCRADILADEFDKFECLYHPEYVERMLDSIREQDVKENFLEHLRKEKKLRNMSIINSWHINENESDAMWKIYGYRGYGIAIQSTFDRLTKSLDVFKENNVFIGKVFYSPEKIKFGNVFYPYMVKRKCFEHERELRALILNVWANYEKKKLDVNKISHPGEYIPVDLNVLIENVFLAPNTKNWVFELVKSVSKKYNLNKSVNRSVIDIDPY